MVTIPNDILLTDNNDIQFSATGDMATAAELLGDENKARATIAQWVRNRIQLDYLSGHPELQSLDNFVSELNDHKLSDNAVAALSKYVSDELLKHEFMEKVEVNAVQDSSNLQLILNVDYKIKADPKPQNLQAIWEE